MLFVAGSAFAQVAIPKGPTYLPGFTHPIEPKKLTPLASEFYDAKYKIKLHFPAGWDVSRKDGILSSFLNDTRNGSARMDVRGVATINYNPYPPTTFSGALFYYSVTPRSTADACAKQTAGVHLKPVGTIVVNGVTFHHGRDEHGMQCTESRDDVFTTLRGNACVRFDLVINTFCAASASALEINARQLGDIQSRLAQILGSVRFDGK